MKNIKHDRIILFIGGLKIVKGLLLLMLCAGLFGLVNDDWASQFQTWIRHINADAHIKVLENLLNKLSDADDRKYIRLGIAVLVYAVLFFTEGIGLLYRKRWAEWLTVIITSSFLPFEVYEIIKKFTAVRLGALLLNLAIVIYLIWRMRHELRRRKL